LCFFSSRRRHTRLVSDWSSDVCSSDLADLARRIRAHALRMVHRVNASHIGGCLSIADILAVLYGSVLRVDPKRPDWPDRDRFIRSEERRVGKEWRARWEGGAVRHMSVG